MYHTCFSRLRCPSMKSFTLSDGEYYEMVKSNFERADRVKVVRTTTNYATSIVSLLSCYQDLLFNWELPPHSSIIKDGRPPPTKNFQVDIGYKSDAELRHFDFIVEACWSHSAAETFVFYRASDSKMATIYLSQNNASCCHGYRVQSSCSRHYQSYNCVYWSCDTWSCDSHVCTIVSVNPYKMYTDYVIQIPDHVTIMCVNQLCSSIQLCVPMNRVMSDHVTYCVV